MIRVKVVVVDPMIEIDAQIVDRYSVSVTMTTNVEHTELVSCDH